MSPACLLLVFIFLISISELCLQAMAAGDNDVVYKVSEDDKSDDVLDDEALIKAYNRAVSTNENGIGAGKQPSSSSGSGPHKQQKKKGNKRTDGHHTQQKAREWKVGDFCRCTYSVDGVCYEARVKSVDHDTCVIRYFGYGNEEEVYLSELLPSEGRIARQRQTELAKRENAHGCPTPPSEDDHSAPAAHGPRTNDGYSQYHNTSFHSSHSLPPAPPMEPLLGRLPPFVKHSMPPPPPIPPGDLPNNEEALASMLMSWYMTGYHTGYYQGLQESKSSKKGCCCCRCNNQK